MRAQPAQTGFTDFGQFLVRVLVVFFGMSVFAVFLIDRIEEMPTETERCAEKLTESLVRMKGNSPLDAIEALERAETRALIICSGSA